MLSASKIATFAVINKRIIEIQQRNRLEVDKTVINFALLLSSNGSNCALVACAITLRDTANKKEKYKMRITSLSLE